MRCFISRHCCKCVLILAWSYTIVEGLLLKAKSVAKAIAKSPQSVEPVCSACILARKYSGMESSGE